MPKFTFKDFDKLIELKDHPFMQGFNHAYHFIKVNNFEITYEDGLATRDHILKIENKPVYWICCYEDNEVMDI